MSEHEFTYKVTVKATRTDGDGKFDVNDLELVIRLLLEDQDGESVYVDSEDEGEIAFDTSWTVELPG